VASEAFPAERIIALIYAAFAYLDTVSGMVAWLDENWLVIVFIALYFFAISTISIVANHFRSKRAEKYNGSSKKEETLSGKIIGSFFWTAILVSFSIVILLMSGLVTSFPSLLGESAGRRLAIEEKKDFAKGCVTAKDTCYSLRKEDGTEIARGFKIAETNERVILFLNGISYDYSLKKRDLQSIPKS
jgi:hypothetical protein